MKSFLLLLLMLVSTFASAQTKLPALPIIIGNGTDKTADITFDRAGVNDPKLRWDLTTGHWLFSNDGTTFGELVSKSYVDSAVAGATIPDASTTEKGKIKLAGDLGGTADLPTVPALPLINDRITSVEDSVNLISPILDGFQDDLTALGGRVTTNEDDIDALDTRVDEAESDISDLSAGKVNKVSSTDNAVTRFDGTTGNIQTSSATLDDVGQLSATSFNAPLTSSTSSFSGVQINNNSVGTAGTDSLTLRGGLSGSAGVNISGTLVGLKGVTWAPVNDSTTTGSNASVTSFDAKYVRFTDSSLSSIAMIPQPSGTGAREIALINATGNTIVIRNNLGATTANRILTGSGRDLKFKNGMIIPLTYNITSLRWVVSGGAGGDSATTILNRVFIDDFESSSISDYNPADFELSTLNPLHGEVSALISHPTTGTPYSFRRSFLVDSGFRGRNSTLSFKVKSDALPGTLKVSLGCNTEDDVLAGQIVTTTNVTGGETYTAPTFNIPATCDVITYTFAGFVSDAAFSQIDDVQISTTQLYPGTSGLIQEADTQVTSFGSSGISSVTSPWATRILSNNIVEAGSNISVVSNSTNGTRFYVNKTGVCSISYSEASNANSAQTEIFIGKNMTSILARDNQVQNTASTNEKRFSASWTGILKEGDFVSPGFGSAVAGNGLESTWTITCQGSLKQVSVNTNSKIKIPTSEVRFEGSSSRGSSSTSIVRYDNLVKFSGDALESTSDAALATVIKVKRAGRVTITSTARLAANSVAGPSINQASLTTFDNPKCMHGNGTGAESYNSCTYVYDASENDIIRVTSQVSPTANGTLNSLNVTHQDLSVQVGVSNTLPQFLENDTNIIVSGGSVAGSGQLTGFSSVSVNLGQAATYASNAFTIQEAGMFTMDGQFALTSTSGSTPQFSINGVPQFGGGSPINVATAAASAHLTRYLNKGDVVTFINAGSGAVNNGFMAISKSGKPVVKGVDVTPFVKLNQAQPLKMQSSFITNTSAYAINATVTGAFSSTNGNTTDLYSYNSTTGLYTVTKKSGFVLNLTIVKNGAGTTQPAINVNGTDVAVDSSVTAGVWTTVSYNQILDAGTTFSFRGATGAFDSPKVSVTATELQESNPNVVAANETFSLANNPVYWSATQCTSSQIGCYNTYSYAINTNTKTLCNVRPLQTDANISIQGFSVFARPYNQASFCGGSNTLSRFELVVGKDFKGWTSTIYKNNNRTIAGQLNSFYLGNTIRYGAELDNYDATTGIYTFDAAPNSTGVTTAAFIFSDASQPSNGFVDLSFSKSPALSSLNLGVVAGAWRTSTSTLTATSAPVIWNVTDDDTVGMMNASNGQARCDETGRYQVNTNIRITGTIALNTQAQVTLQRGDGTTFTDYRDFITFAGGAMSGQNAQLSAVVRCAKGQFLRITARSTATGAAIDTTNNRTWLDITKVKE